MSIEYYIYKKQKEEDEDEDFEEDEDEILYEEGFLIIEDDV